MQNLRCQLTAALLGASLLTASAATTRYVDVNSTNATPPYTTWATASTNIQVAVDVASVGDEIVVTNGVYRIGGRAVVSQMSNRVAVTKAVKVRSVNGPEATIIQGYQLPGVTNGDGAVRCVYLASGATLSGFTLTNGATRTTASTPTTDTGGAVWCASPTVVVSNCVLTGNAAFNYGGGAYSGVLTNCILSGNTASKGGGAYSSTLNNCVLTGNAATSGGGVYSGTLSGCSLTGNTASSTAGGAYNSTLINCTLAGNAAPRGGGADSGVLRNCTLTTNTAFSSDGGGVVYAQATNCVFMGNQSAGMGGGAYSTTLQNCALTGNSARYGGAVAWGTANSCTATRNFARTSGGGAYVTALNNCIVFDNLAFSYPNYIGGPLNYCCTTPLPSSGVGNIEVDPQMASASHLSAVSPCRGAGSAVYVRGTDIDGESWASPPSMGCDEVYVGTATNVLSVAIQADYTNVAVGFGVNVTALIAGQVTASRWNFGDGTIVSNRPYASHAWSLPGPYLIELRAYNDSNPGGVTATVAVQVVTQRVHYVALGNASPMPPYASWATAATNIQDAVDAATNAGSLVLVSNGNYRTGGRVVYGGLSNRVAVTVPLVLQSVNGPEAAAIEGWQVPGSTNGDAAVRCIFLAEGARLIGFTLTNGATRAVGDQDLERGGGAAWCSSATVVISNCVSVGNSAAYGGGGGYGGSWFNCFFKRNSASYGGAVFYSTLHNCTLSGNTAASGGAAYSAALRGCVLTDNSASGNGGAMYSSGATNCTITGNFAQNLGGGVSGGLLVNSIVYHNSASNAPNANAGTFYFCCTTPLPASGTNNIETDPGLASASHLSLQSPCRWAGSAASAWGTDIDGEQWASPPSMGCDEVYPGTATGSVSVGIRANYTTVLAGYAVDFRAEIEGRVTASQWDFGNGVVVSNRVYVSHAWDDLGDHPVVLRAYNDSSPGGISTTTLVQVVAQPVHYVALGNASPVPPYTSWAMAATNIQDAVEAATVPGALVLVTNGTYANGGRVVFGAMTNRVAAMMPLVIQSVGGPQATVIQGYQVPGTTNGDNGVRCVYLASGTVLSGFTLAGGATRAAGDVQREQSGGGVWCVSAAALVSNCVFAGNAAAANGGGAYSGLLVDCVLSGNTAASGGGAHSSALNRCTLTTNRAVTGGGAYGGSLSNCTVTGCSAFDGGGVSMAALTDSTLSQNSASTNGGGALSASLTNCTLLGNVARYGAGAFSTTLRQCLVASNAASYRGGGISGGTLYNCTLSGNTAVGFGGGGYTGVLFSCTLNANSGGVGGGAHSSKLNDCLISGNVTAGDGGGANASALDRCTVRSNLAYSKGGGIAAGSAHSCAIYGNSANQGGGAISATLTNCTLTGNSATANGGVGFSTLNNCIAYYNRSTYQGANHGAYSTLNNCCTTPLPDGGLGNLDAEPRLASVSHLSADSPCLGTGAQEFASGTDLDRETWGNPPSIGCDEYRPGDATGPLSVAITTWTNVAAGFALDLRALIEGRVGASAWDFGNGILLSNRPYASHAWAAGGDYAVVLRAWNDSNPGGVSATVTVRVVVSPVCYVAAGNPTPAWPFTSWAIAATNIQDAVDAALPGGQVVVSNGLYSNGGRAVFGNMTNRVLVDKPVVLRSVNGPQVTGIEGYQLPGTVTGDGAIRGVCLKGGAALSGFTVTKGATRNNGSFEHEQYGGGVWCESFTETVSNCVLTANVGQVDGGGAYLGTLSDCLISSNSAYLHGGGTYGSGLTRCTLIGNWASSDGGGVNLGSLESCTLVGNSTVWDGGGALTAYLNNCTLVGNSARYGGGAYDSTLNNCTLINNVGTNVGGGAHSCTLNNSVICSNSSPSGANYYVGALNYCCTTPMPEAWRGVGNLEMDPLLVNYTGSNLRLQANSPCINAGNDAYVTTATDLDGNPRIVSGTVDIGAYEIQGSGSRISYAWLQQYGWPTDGSVDFLDPDRDGHNNWQEWRADTVPTNAFSRLALLAPTNAPSGLAVTWQSVPTRSYFLERGTNVAGPPPAFAPLATNLPGQSGTTTFTDTTATNGGQFFYRVGVQP